MASSNYKVYWTGYRNTEIKNHSPEIFLENIEPDKEDAVIIMQPRQLLESIKDSPQPKLYRQNSHVHRCRETALYTIASNIEMLKHMGFSGNGCIEYYAEDGSELSEDRLNTIKSFKERFDLYTNEGIKVTLSDKRKSVIVAFTNNTSLNSGYKYVSVSFILFLFRHIEILKDALEIFTEVTISQFWRHLSYFMIDKYASKANSVSDYAMMSLFSHYLGLKSTFQVPPIPYLCNGPINAAKEFFQFGTVASWARYVYMPIAKETGFKSLGSYGSTSKDITQYIMDNEFENFKIENAFAYIEYKKFFKKPVVEKKVAKKAVSRKPRVAKNTGKIPVSFDDYVRSMTKDINVEEFRLEE